jgi:integrase
LIQVRLVPDVVPDPPDRSVGSRLVYGDEPPTGALVVRSSATGSPLYEAKWRDSKRRQRKRRLGPAWLEREGDSGWRKRRGRVRAGFLDERRAHVEMARVISEQEEELLREPLNRGATFGGAAAAWLDYLEHEKRVKPSTLEDYRLMLADPSEPRRGAQERSARLMRAFGGAKLSTVTTADIARFLAALDREDVSARTVNKHRQVLHAIFEYARRDDAFRLRENPVSRTEKRPEGGAKPVETFDPEEVHAIARAARVGLHRPRPPHDYSPDTVAEWQRINGQDAAMYVVAAFTGLRLGELLALRWSDVEFAGARLTVARAMSAGEEASTTKSRRFRVVPLADQAAAELERVSRRSHFTDRTDLVFCRADGGPLDRSTVRKRFTRAQKAAGVRMRRFHDLRHTFGSLAIRNLDSVTVQSMMGHSRLATTERYLHAKPRTDDAARLSAAFAEDGAVTANEPVAR